MTKQMKKIIWIAVALVLIGGVYFLVTAEGKPGELDQFAQCLGEKGATFYGAFWCPACKEQKAAFGKSAKHLPYVECSTPDGKNQLNICKQENITGYPTWEFAQGERETAVFSPEELAEKTGCQLPQS
jgi:thiol-disulfide isomerase/thioredoxin